MTERKRRGGEWVGGVDEETGILDLSTAWTETKEKEGGCGGWGVGVGGGERDRKEQLRKNDDFADTELIKLTFTL